MPDATRRPGAAPKSDSLLAALRRVPGWYLIAAALIGLVLLVTLVLAIFLYCLGAVTRETGTFWAGIIAAVVTLAVFAIGRFADEMVKLQTRADTQLDLTVALFAEIQSNLKQQFYVITKETVEQKFQKMVRRLKEEPRASDAVLVPASPESKDRGSGTTLAVADRDNVIFNNAMKQFENIPFACIGKVVEYYNLDGMLDLALSTLSSKEFSRLDVSQQVTLLVYTYELANRVAEAGNEASELLLKFIEMSKRTDADVVATLKYLRPQLGFMFERGRDLPACLHRLVTPPEGSDPPSQPPAS